MRSSPTKRMQSDRSKRDLRSYRAGGKGPPASSMCTAHSMHGHQATASLELTGGTLHGRKDGWTQVHQERDAGMMRRAAALQVKEQVGCHSSARGWRTAG